MTQEIFENIKNEIENATLNADEVSTIEDTLNSSKNGMTKEQYDALISALDKARESQRPFTVVTNDTIAVAGNANDTKVNRYEYTITFERPVYEDGVLTGTSIEDKTYKNVYVTPRKQTQVIKMLSMLLPYFRKVDEEGNVVPLEPLEAMEVLVTLDEQIYDIMYDLVATVMGISEEDKEYMKVGSVITATLMFIMNTPEIVNEAETFFE